MPSNLVPSTVPGTAPLHPVGGTSQQERHDTNVPSGLVPGTLLWAYFWAFLGHRGGTSVAPGTVRLRNLKGTSRKACLENPDRLRGSKLEIREIPSFLERPCGSQQRASMLLGRQGGFLRREGGFLRRYLVFIVRRAGGEPPLKKGGGWPLRRWGGF